jgi:chorismate mutase
MEEQRNKISKVDSEIIKQLAERRDLSREIINLKNEKQSLIRDKSREKELLTK